VPHSDTWRLNAGRYELTTEAPPSSTSETRRDPARDALVVSGPLDLADPPQLAVQQVGRDDASTTFSFEVTEKGRYRIELKGDDGRVDLEQTGHAPRDRDAGRWQSLVAWVLFGLTGLAFMGGVTLVAVGLARRRPTAPVPRPGGS
jgi:hypothetical protein